MGHRRCLSAPWLRARTSRSGESDRYIVAAVYSAVVRTLAIFVYCYGAVVAPTLHQAFHHPDHIHLGESIVSLHDHEDEEESAGHVPQVLEYDADHAGTAYAERDHENAWHDTTGHGRHHHPQSQSHDHERGAKSLWHFGAALSDHLDRVPTVAAARSVAWIARTSRAERPCTTRAARTLRLRGPPLRLPVHSLQ